MKKVLLGFVCALLLGVPALAADFDPKVKEKALVLQTALDKYAYLSRGDYEYLGLRPGKNYVDSDVVPSLCDVLKWEGLLDTLPVMDGEFYYYNNCDDFRTGLMIYVGDDAVLYIVYDDKLISSTNEFFVFQTKNNHQRRNDLELIGSAIEEYLWDNWGYVGGLDNSVLLNEEFQRMSASWFPAVDICSQMIPEYIHAPDDGLFAEMPFDLNNGFFIACQDYDLGYEIKLDEGIVTLRAPHAQLGEVIEYEVNQREIEQHFARLHDEQRQRDLNAIAEALYSYIKFNEGDIDGLTWNRNLFAGMQALTIGSDGWQADICSALVVNGYLEEMPYDPIDWDAQYWNCADYNTGYTIEIGAEDEVIYLRAPSAQLLEEIVVEVDILRFY